MLGCKADFREHAEVIYRTWRANFLSTIGNWNRAAWWAASFIVFPFLIVMGTFPPFLSREVAPVQYFREVYCPAVGDCLVSVGGAPLPAWVFLYVFLMLAAIVSGSVTRWGYRRRRWCLAWWGYLVYKFVGTYFVIMAGEGIIFFGLEGAPIPTALVGYSLWVVYTVQFFRLLLPPMRRLWRGERIDFRPPPLVLSAGAGSAVALLGILGVALGRVFSDMPHGNWGILIFGALLTPVFVFGLSRDNVQELLTLAPWRIVLEAEAGEKAEGEGQ